ncbi:hypothetical protein [Mycobacterium sp. 141]|uniref:hypothetical protein n=1 Tax=Mycobacterium sp. 141 TaxID=1120797 RepID=UPI00037D409A|nr:hypothetical protein [Mycobacterium sp. 141]
MHKGVTGPALPPSRFAAGYTAGAPGMQTAVPSTPGAGPLPGGRGPQATSQHAGPSAAAPGSLPQTGDAGGYAAVALVLVVVFGPFAVPVTTPMALAARARARRTGVVSPVTANATLIIGAIYLIIGVTAVALWFATSDAPAV